MEKRIRALERQIEKIKSELSLLGELRPGSLSKQYNVCGNPNCRCKDDPPKRHGPYYQLSFTRKGKSRSKFVKKPQLSEVQKQLKNYARLRSLVDRWIELSSELCLLRLQEREQASRA
jgi:hypothetical protein